MKKARYLSLLCALALILPLPAVAAGSASFRDVKSGDWFYPYVTELAGLGGVSGYEDGTFQPDGAITRAEVAVMALGVFPVDEILREQFGGSRIAELEEEAREENGDYWANPYLVRAGMCGVLAWDWDKALWSRPATRAEIAHILVMVYMVSKEYDQEIGIPPKDAAAYRRLLHRGGVQPLPGGGLLDVQPGNHLRGKRAGRLQAQRRRHPGGVLHHDSQPAPPGEVEAD